MRRKQKFSWENKNGALSVVLCTPGKTLLRALFEYTENVLY